MNYFSYKKNKWPKKKIKSDYNWFFFTKLITFKFLLLESEKFLNFFWQKVNIEAWDLGNAMSKTKKVDSKLNMFWMNTIIIIINILFYRLNFVQQTLKNFRIKHFRP